MLNCLRNLWAISLFLLVFCTLQSNKAFAAKGCYDIHQFEAEQGLRIHSELLVISLTCQKVPGYSTLYSKYQQFTKKNQILLSDYENRLINFYKNEGARSPAKKLHSLRTDLANEISQHAIVMSVTSFCTYFGKRIDKALNMEKHVLEKWARQIWKDKETSEPVCKKDMQVLLQEAAAKEARRKKLMAIHARKKKKQQN